MNMFDAAEAAADEDAPKRPKASQVAQGLTPELAVAVREMNKQWAGGRVTGPTLDHWNRIYAALCVGRSSVAELRIAAALADAAFLLQQGRPGIGS